MSNSGEKSCCVYLCVSVCQHACIFLCLHIIWINTHRKEALKQLTSCRGQKQQADLVHQMFCQLHRPFNQCNKQLFQHLSLSPPGHESSSLSAYWRPSICSFSPLPFFHHSSFFVFQWELSSLTFVPLERTAAGNKDRQPITHWSEWPWVCESHS